ncbi:MAG: phage major capsid protein [Mycobacterium sp.]
MEGNAFEYFQQTVRTNAATAVPDAGTKPTSTLTVAPHQDRCRVIAHLSEPCPIRLWYDHDEFVAWLTSAMVNGVLDGLEHQIVAGDGTGENMRGLLSTPGLTQVPFDTDPATTLRSALTALQVKGEQPNGWALHPADAEAIDLTRWGSAGGFLSGGYENDTGNGFGTSDNVFGSGLKRVITPSIPVGTAILGDFTRLKVYVRQDAHIDVDASGPLFTTNQFVARGEGRYGIGVLRPSAFARCDLTGTTTSKTAAAKN